MPFQSRRFEDGFFFNHDDFNNMSRFLESQLWDTWSTLARLDDADVNAGNLRSQPNLGHAYCFSHGGAPYPSATTRTIKLHGGVIAQQVTQGAVGDAPRFLAYFLEDNEVNHQLTVGDATFNRFDILCVRLSVDDFDSTSRDEEDASTRVNTSQLTLITRRVKVESQIVIGTPGASPVEPATPAGWVKVASILVPTLFNAVITPDNIGDFRMPMGLCMYECTAAEIIGIGAFIGAATWLAGGSPFGYAQATALSGGEAKLGVMVKHVPPNTSRLLQITVVSRDGVRASWDFELCKWDFATHGSTGDSLLFGMEDPLIPVAASGDHVLRKTFFTDPYWANGERNGYASRETEADSLEGYKRIGMLVRATALSAGFIGPIRFLFAGGH
jgi:hypothetical protein